MRKLLLLAGLIIGLLGWWRLQPMPVALAGEDVCPVGEPGCSGAGCPCGSHTENGQVICNRCTGGGNECSGPNDCSGGCCDGGTCSSDCGGDDSQLQCEAGETICRSYSDSCVSSAKLCTDGTIVGSCHSDDLPTGIGIRCRQATNEWCCPDVSSNPTCSVALSPTNAVVVKGQTAPLTAYVSPQDGTVSSVDFSSDNTSVATVNPGSDADVIYQTTVAKVEVAAPLCGWELS